MSDHTYTDLFTTLTGTVHAPGHPVAVCTVSLFWSTAEPSSVVISVKHRDDALVTWEVARKLFTAAEGFTPAWVGGGDFAVAFRPAITDGMSKCLFMFKPSYCKPQWALVYVPLVPVRDFILHALVKLSEEQEQQVIDRQINTALARILQGTGE